MGFDRVRWGRARQGRVWQDRRRAEYGRSKSKGMVG